jgi:oligopeptidase A
MSASSSPESPNPLLAGSGLPRFDAIGPQHVVPGMRALLGELERGLDALEAGLSPTWEGLVERIERLGDRLAWSWGVVGHLMGVRNSEELRRAQEEVQPDVVRFSMRLAQSRPIYQGLQKLRGGPEWSRLDAAQRRAAEILLRDARLSGVGLEGEARERFNRIQTELAELATQFSNHVLDATKAFALVLREPAEVEGMPGSWRELAAQSAREAGFPEASAERGPWRATLDHPSLLPILQHARRRDLRERLYRANITRASAGELDNAPLITRILELRREEAALLGMGSYAELSLVPKMAREVAAVERLLEQLRAPSLVAGQRELEELRALAREREPQTAGELQHWDVPYWAERLREARYAYTDEELRPYFPLPRVLAGLFELTERLFGARIEPADDEAPVWHPDARFFRVRDAGGEPLAAFYLDPYSRPAEKRGGAWMDVCMGRSRTLAPPGQRVRLPVAYLVCNQTPPVGGKPSLMSFHEVETLFHEFGHGLQHLLTTVDCGLVSGIHNVEWDAVELPSQFMENWCYEPRTLRAISGHYQTGEPLPDALAHKLRAARVFRAGSQMLRQLGFSLTDLELHHGFDPRGPETPFDVDRRVAQRTALLPPLPEDRFLCSFSHIFAGGYAAGYYSYKWAEVLSADAFAAFEEAGLDDEGAQRVIGRRFRETVLALGGSRPAMEVFRALRGREPRVDALLRHSGLV